MSRLHTALVVGCLALVPLSPLALWAYAKAASVDRGRTIAANERVLRSLSRMRGAQRVGEHSYPLPRWGHEGALVPVDGYRTELFLRLPQETPAAAILAHYHRAVTTWRARGVTIEIAVFGRRNPQTYGVYVSQ